MTETPPAEGLQPGDIHYPYVDPVHNDGEIPPDTPPVYVPPWDETAEPKTEEPAAEEAPAEPETG